MLAGVMHENGYGGLDYISIIILHEVFREKGGGDAVTSYIHVCGKSPTAANL